MKILSLLMGLSIFSIGINIFILLPLALIPKIRPWVAGAFFISSFLFALTGWFMGGYLTFTIWGFGPLVFGLFLMGVGVFPLGMLAALFNGRWGAFGTLEEPDKALFEYIVIMLALQRMKQRCQSAGRLLKAGTFNFWSNTVLDCVCHTLHEHPDVGPALYDALGREHDYRAPTFCTDLCGQIGDVEIADHLLQAIHHAATRSPGPIRMSKAMTKDVQDPFAAFYRWFRNRLARRPPASVWWCSCTW